MIDDLPPPPPIFELIEQHGGVDRAEMFEVYNMGIGFCVVVPAADVATTLAILARHGRQARVIGHAVADPTRRDVAAKSWSAAASGSRRHDATRH